MWVLLITILSSVWLLTDSRNNFFFKGISLALTYDIIYFSRFWLSYIRNSTIEDIFKYHDEAHTILLHVSHDFSQHHYKVHTLQCLNSE